MSNDVHLAKVSKIQRSSDVVKSARNRHCIYGFGFKNETPIDIRTEHNGIETTCLFSGLCIGTQAAASQIPSDSESPDQTQRDTTTESDNNISSCSTLDIVNKVENLSMHHLETKIRDLTQRLQQVEEEKMATEHLLMECNNEKELCLKRLEIVSAAHECRITEMHCVIAELSKKLRNKQECTIMEEHEPEDSEPRYQDGSIYNSEMNLTNPDAECQTDPIEEADYSHSHGDVDNDFCQSINHEHKIRDNISKGQLEALQEEVFHLKAQIALLQAEIANANSPIIGKVVEEPQTIEYHQPRVEIMLSAESIVPLEKHYPIHKCHKGNTKEENEKEEADLQKFEDEVEQEKTDDTNELHNVSTITAEDTYVTSPHNQPAIPKMAERVKLKCASKQYLNDVINIKGKNVEMENADSVENLLSNLKLSSHSLTNSVMESSQFDTELKRVQRKVEHLKVQNTVLSLTLDESKEHCERLYLLCGKYESNAIALQAALNCSDRAIEAYDVMLALLESKLALIKEKSMAAEESRKAVEAVARHLLDRLESEKNLCENSLGPWQNSFSIPDKSSTKPWTMEDDNRLRYHVSKLKGRRTTVQNTLVQLESPFSDTYEDSRLGIHKELSTVQHEKNTRLDLEMAILMQELLNLREENIAIKMKAEHAEREKQYANDRISVLNEALKQLQLQLQLNIDSAELFQQHQQQQHYQMEHRNSGGEHSALTEQQLIEALSRESELKSRIQSLIASVSETQKISDEKYEHLHNNVRELQKGNQHLSQIIEQNKRKYQVRIRKLEQKIMNMSLEVGRQHNKIYNQSMEPQKSGMSFVLESTYNKYTTHSTNGASAIINKSPNNMVPEATL